MEGGKDSAFLAWERETAIATSTRLGCGTGSSAVPCLMQRPISSKQTFRNLLLKTQQILHTAA